MLATEDARYRLVHGILSATPNGKPPAKLDIKLSSLEGNKVQQKKLHDFVSHMIGQCHLDLTRDRILVTW